LQLDSKLKIAVRYPYDASGTKWAANANGVITTYIGAFIYEGTNLTAVYTMNGRVVPVGSSWEYQYYLKENLGSNRLLFKAGPTIIEEYHNYAYGERACSRHKMSCGRSETEWSPHSIARSGHRVKTL
jgi:hypothetical protein